MTPEQVKVRKQLLRDLFVRVCRDSGFRLDTHRAANLVAQIAKAHPLDIWMAMPSLEVMDEVARGTHPAVRQALKETNSG